MNKQNHIRALYALLVLLTFAVGFQNWLYRQRMKAITLYGATISVVDANTGAILRPVVSTLPVESGAAPFFSRGTSSKENMKWECIHYEPQTIKISANGYETQSFIVATANTNIEARLITREE